jgi:hypothetical protein
LFTLALLGSRPEREIDSGEQCHQLSYLIR